MCFFHMFLLDHQQLSRSIPHIAAYCGILRMVHPSVLGGTWWYHLRKKNSHDDLNTFERGAHPGRADAATAAAANSPKAAFTSVLGRDDGDQMRHDYGFKGSTWGPMKGSKRDRPLPVEAEKAPGY